MATLLSIVTDMTGELALPQPAAVATATDPQTIQLFSLAKRAVKDLQQEHPWTFLQKLMIINLATVVTDAGTLTSGNATITGLLAGTITSLNATSASAWIVASDTLGGIPVSARVVSASGTSVTLDSQVNTSGSSTIQFSQDTYSLPTDFDRYVGNTWWDRTNRWALIGPDSPQIDQWHRSGIVVIGPRRHFRQVGSSVTAPPPGQYMWRIWPPLTTATTNPQELVFEYIGANCISVSGGSTVAANFANDADVPLLDATALTLGLKWRWLQAKRYQYADYQQEWMEYVNRLKSRDGGTRVLSLSPMVDSDYLVDSRNVQDGFYPGTSSVSGQ
jgi:hypothetical protein